jgi:hypothetical protein
MKAILHAIGRPQDLLPFVALGARVHTVTSLAEAEEAMRKATGGEEKVLVILSEEFSQAAKGAGEALVFLSPGSHGARRVALEQIREKISLSLGVDLIARAGRSDEK